MDYEVFHAKNVSELSYNQNQKAANMINLIEEKTNRRHTEKSSNQSEERIQWTGTAGSLQ